MVVMPYWGAPVKSVRKSFSVTVSTLTSLGSGGEVGSCSAVFGDSAQAADSSLLSVCGVGCWGGSNSFDSRARLRERGVRGGVICCSRCLSVHGFQVKGVCCGHEAITSAFPPVSPVFFRRGLKKSNSLCLRFFWPSGLSPAAASSCTGFWRFCNRAMMREELRYRLQNEFHAGGRRTWRTREVNELKRHSQALVCFGASAIKAGIPGAHREIAWPPIGRWNMHPSVAASPSATADLSVHRSGM
jgi:hypothetical protein